MASVRAILNCVPGTLLGGGHGHELYCGSWGGELPLGVGVGA